MNRLTWQGLFSMALFNSMKRVLLWMCLGCFLCQELYSQALTTRNDFTGNWEDAASWEPEWKVPSNTIYARDVQVNGLITINNSLYMTGASSDLIVNDTLIVHGDLSLGNESSLFINENGILIVNGNLYLVNQTALTTNGYLVVTGNLYNTSLVYGGAFISNRNPTGIFFGGEVPSLDNSSYPAIDCTDPVTIPYMNSGCSYGSMADLMNDPVYSFFSSICPKGRAASNSPVCTGDSIRLTSSGGVGYNWTGPDGYSVNEQNPSIANATLSMAGQYKLTVMSSTGCKDTVSLFIKVNETPNVFAGNDQVLTNSSETQMNAGLTTDETGVWTVLSGSGIMENSGSPSSLVTGLSVGENTFYWTVTNGHCESGAQVLITVRQVTVIPSVITPNGDNRNDFFIVPLEDGPVELTIFNQWGMKEYSNPNYLNEWEGRNSHGAILPDDTYYYFIRYKNGDIKKGSVLIKTR